MLAKICQCESCIVDFMSAKKDCIFPNIQLKCVVNRLLPGDNTEKIWVNWFLAKPKMIAGGGLGLAVSPPLPGGPG